MSAETSPDPTDRAVELIRSLDAQRTDGPLLAEPLERLIARLIDLGLFLSLFVVVGLIAGAIIMFVDPPREGELRPEGNRASAVVSSIAGALLFVAVTANELAAGVTGQTLGKKLYGLTLVDPGTGQPPGVRRAGLRAASWLLPFGLFAVFWGATFPAPASLAAFAGMLLSVVGPLWMFVDRDHRGLQDMVAGTLVRRPR